jgi:hypothetical protein
MNFMCFVERAASVAACFRVQMYKLYFIGEKILLKIVGKILICWLPMLAAALACRASVLRFLPTGMHA